MPIALGIRRPAGRLARPRAAPWARAVGIVLRAAALAAVLLAATPAPVTAGSLPVRTTPVALDPSDPDRQTVGGLRYRGGLVLESSAPGFGGFSGLEIDPAGRHLQAVSDRGHRLRAELSYDAGGRLSGVVRASLEILRGPDGRPLIRKTDGDAESITALADGGFVVAFEHNHRLLRYGADGPPTPLPQPPDLAQAPANGGIEALATLADGRLLALTEYFRTADGSSVRGWLSAPGGWAPLTYVTTGEFEPTGAARLPGGDVVVVQRAFDLIRGGAVRIARIPGADVRPGARLTDVEIARWRAPLTVDNFEGVSARSGPAGETLIYILSDDNFLARQRTILMMFELTPNGG